MPQNLPSPDLRHDVFVIDDQHPEDLAMLQAMYSRSPASVVQHLEKLKKTDSGKFMDQYYVGYGHASIGDCGVTTCFVEQVSMLVAKAIQDNPLYNGQEASTRYLDFSKQAVLDPYQHAASAEIQQRWQTLYQATLPGLVAGLEARHPFDPTAYKNEKVWRNALNARAFDIARSLLPMGTTTLLSWTTSLRAARDHLRRLKLHPLPEVRQVAQTIFQQLRARYPHSFRPDDMTLSTPLAERDAYAERFSLQDHFLTASTALHRFSLTDKEQTDLAQGQLIARRESLDLNGLLANEMPTLRQRPVNAALPRRLESYGCYNFLFLLDFGSFRDIQRHRNGLCQIPIVDGRYGLHPWYRAQFAALLPAAQAQSLETAIADQWERLANLQTQGLQTRPELTQYLYPMGAMGLVHVAYAVPETVYVGELRSAKTVHPTLRPLAQAMLNVLAQDIPDIALYGDRDLDDWTPKRGEQTIADKPAKAATG